MYPKYILELIKDNKLEEALNYLFNLIKKHPFDTVSFNDIGYLLVNMGNYDEAISYLNIALNYSKIDNEIICRPTIFLNLAVSYKLKGDVENSDDSYLKAKNNIDEYFKLIKNNNDSNYQQAMELEKQLKNKFQFTNI